MRNQKVLWVGAIATLMTASVATAEPTQEQRLRALERKQEELSRELEQVKDSKANEKRVDEKGKVDEVERRQGILTEELRRLRDALVLPENQELKSAYGLGPAASKVYGVQRGLSIGGYGEANFKGIVSDRGGDNDVFDMLRFVLYFGYKFNDWIVLNSELEFEHAATDDGGEVAVEFATIDFLLHPMANARAGLVLLPIGFVNEMHEPPFYHGNVRPPVEQRILPSTWNANGIGFFGELLPGLEYRTYGVTSLNAEEFESSGIREGRQHGANERADDWSWVGRVDYTFLPGSLVGGSAFVGDQGQHQKYAGERRDVFMQLYEAHVQARVAGVEFRALGAVTLLDDARSLSIEKGETVADTMYGWYAEVAYDVLPLLLPDTTQYLAPWVRYSRLDTQSSVPDGLPADQSQDQQFIEVGLSYKPIHQVVLKLDYRNQDADRGNIPDEIRVGAGYVF